MKDKKDTAKIEKTPYEKARTEWSDRMGDARTQARNWQLTGFLSLALLVLFLILFIVAESRQKNYVYVAQVGPDQSTHMVALPQTLHASSAVQAYFVGNFITDIMSLPLDPVVARQNWFSAYSMADGQAITQLTHYAQTANPFAHLGSLTSSVQITDFNKVSDQSIQFEWTVTTYDNQGQVQQQIPYSGIFTLAKGPVPATQDALLQNPFGLKIIYFSLNSEGSPS